MVMKCRTLIIKTNTTIGNKERDMDIIAKAVAEALAKKGIDVQQGYNKLAENTNIIKPTVKLTGKIVNKGIKHIDHTIEVATTKKES